MSDETYEQDESPTVAELGPATIAQAPPGKDAFGGDTQPLDGRATASASGILPEAAIDPVHVGRFRILERVGQGGMGYVYAAHDDELNRDVAIKILRSDLAVGVSGRERLVREAQAIASLSHPNIVHVYEVGHEGDRVFMAMELVRGRTLRKWCAAKKRHWTEIVDVFLAAGAGLCAAHTQGIVHRDFKPDNVLVADDGRPRVVDFGLARTHVGNSTEGDPGSGEHPAMHVTPTSDHLLPLDLTATGIVVGTPAYMAPEQLAKSEPDARTDQFAFCVSLFEMLYGKRPFQGSTYTELVRSILTGPRVTVDAAARHVPRRVHAIVMRGISRNPDERFASMSELLDALSAARAPRSHRALGYAIVGAAALGLVATLSSRSQERTEPEHVEPVDDAWAQIVAATDLPETIDAPLPGDPIGVTVHRLRNGLTIYVAHRPLEAKVAVVTAVRAGSEQERDYSAGLGFLVMSAVTHGTERIGVTDASAERPALVSQHALLDALPAIHDETARTEVLRAAHRAEQATADLIIPNELYDSATALGGDPLNSFRGSGTTFSTRMPAHRVGAWLGILGETIQRPAFRNMLATVHAQLQRYADLTVGERASQIIQRELTPATGLLEDYETASDYLLTFPLADVRSFHASFYRPNNTAIVFVGDITAEQAIAECERVFGAWEPAIIPKRPPVDGPLAQPVVRHEIEDGGPPKVFVSWPLPPTETQDHAAFEVLADALNRHDGLASSLRTTTAGAFWSLTAHRSLQVSATALADQPLAETEAEIMRTLEAIATDRLPDDAWDAALARAELTRYGWARSSRSLAHVIATSFIEHGSWRDVATRLSEPPTRPKLVATARALLARPRVVVHQRTGKSWYLPVPSLPFERVPPRYGQRSAFVRSIVDAPGTPPEPRFLVEGSHYDVQRFGEGRMISVAHESPIAQLSWVIPTGVDEDPFACEAMRALARNVTFAGMDIDAYCTNHLTWVDVIAPAARLQSEAPAVFEWLMKAPLADDQIKDHVRRTLQARAALRNDVPRRETAFHNWALRGEHGISAKLPSDDELSRRAVKALPAALTRLRERAADVLYVGPAPEAIAAVLPAASGPAGPMPRSTALRTVMHDTVLLMDDPTRDLASVHVLMPWPDLSGRLELAGEIHDQTVQARLASGPPTLQPRWMSGAWWSLRDAYTSAGYDCPTADVAIAVTTAVDLVRHQVGEDDFAAAHRRREVTFRAWRPEAGRVPELVLLWGAAESDPRVAQWLVLPGLQYEDMRRYYAATANQPVIVSIVGNASAMDLGALAAFGEVIRISLADLPDFVHDHHLSDGY